MRFVVTALLSFALAPAFHSPALAEVLERTSAKPAPAQLALSKNIYRIEKVKGTCEETVCHEQDVTRWERVCRDDYSHKEVCKDEFVCKPGDDGNARCQYERVCNYEWVNEPRCHDEPRQEKERWCLPEEYECMKDKKVLDHVWKVVLKPAFDPRAVLPKNKTEKFQVWLDGDERAPRLIIKTERSPFKYTHEYRFDAEAKEATLEFRLKN